MVKSCLGGCMSFSWLCRTLVAHITHHFPDLLRFLNPRVFLIKTFFKFCSPDRRQLTYIFFIRLCRIKWICKLDFLFPKMKEKHVLILESVTQTVAIYSSVDCGFPLQQIALYSFVLLVHQIKKEKKTFQEIRRPERYKTCCDKAQSEFQHSIKKKAWLFKYASAKCKLQLPILDAQYPPIWWYWVYIIEQEQTNFFDSSIFFSAQNNNRRTRC